MLFMSTKSIKSNFLPFRCFSLAQNVKQVTFFFLNVLYEYKKHKMSNKRRSNFFLFACMHFCAFYAFMLLKFSCKKIKNVLITSTSILLSLYHLKQIITFLSYDVEVKISSVVLSLNTSIFIRICLFLLQNIR